MITLALLFDSSSFLLQEDVHAYDCQKPPHKKQLKVVLVHDDAMWYRLPVSTFEAMSGAFQH